jgi:O-phospho-L-seryl-tRNASec:L-selenocysteinyl-tRNA synthase
MDDSDIDILSKLVNKTYIKQGLQCLQTKKKKIKVLLEQRRLPLDGWSDDMIEYLLADISSMDSNNFPSNLGVGEREGRVYSNLVSRRHFLLSHGIGRSGDISEVQPKAAGSSLIYKLTQEMVNHSLRIAGLTCIEKSLILPLATGMTITLALLTLKKLYPTKRYVLWPRIDQKSCFKSMICAGLIPIVIENIIQQDGTMITNINEIKRLMIEKGNTKRYSTSGDLLKPNNLSSANNAPAKPAYKTPTYKAVMAARRNKVLLKCQNTDELNCFTKGKKETNK